MLYFGDPENYANGCSTGLCVFPILNLIPEDLPKNVGGLLDCVRFFTSQMTFLSPTQQCQSTKGITSVYYMLIHVKRLKILDTLSLPSVK